MLTDDVKVAYVTGYLEATLGSTTVDLSPEARKRIEHVVAVLKGHSSGSPVSLEPSVRVQ